MISETGSRSGPTRSRAFGSSLRSSARSCTASA
jgi:hypothetical protein